MSHVAPSVKLSAVDIKKFSPGAGETNRHATDQPRRCKSQPSKWDYPISLVIEIRREPHGKTTRQLAKIAPASRYCKRTSRLHKPFGAAGRPMQFRLVIFDFSVPHLRSSPLLLYRLGNWHVMRTRKYPLLELSLYTRCILLSSTLWAFLMSYGSRFFRFSSFLLCCSNVVTNFFVPSLPCGAQLTHWPILSRVFLGGISSVEEFFTPWLRSFLPDQARHSLTVVHQSRVPSFPSIQFIPFLSHPVTNSYQLAASTGSIRHQAPKKFQLGNSLRAIFVGLLTPFPLTLVTLGIQFAHPHRRRRIAINDFPLADANASLDLSGLILTSSIN